MLSQTICDPMDCSPPGSSAHGILKAWILDGCPPPEVFLTQGSNPSVLHLLHCQAASLPLAPPRKLVKWSPISPVAVCCFVKCLYRSTSSQSTFIPRIWVQIWLGSGICDWYWLRDINITTGRSLGSICACLGCPLLLLGTMCHQEVNQGLTSHRRRVPKVYHPQLSKPAKTLLWGHLRLSSPRLAS